MNFKSDTYPELTNKEYRNLIFLTKEKDPELFNSITTYLDEKLENFLEDFVNHEKEYNTWVTLPIDQKVQVILICIGMDLSFFNLSRTQIEEVVPDLLKVYAESLRRKFIKEEESDEIIVDPEYQDLLNEALNAIDASN